ncbi:MAG: DNA recombination protein RmuC [Desulfobacterales bacterium]|nr:DNA recombination protein RmuC [Desulfobacterales bacterium]
MDYLIYILVFLVGGALGGLIAWLVAKSRTGGDLSQGRAEIARLQEVISGKEKELQDRNSRIGDLQGKLTGVEASILKVSEERSAAEAKLEQMQQLQQALEEKTGEIRQLTETITGLKEKQAELETIIEKERIATEEKLQLLEKAKKDLTDTFQAISATALKNSNESFLELAKATLGKYQEGAKRDLELRQNEVKQVVEPIKESLQKYNKQVQEMERVREKAYGGLSQQVESLIATQQFLQKETANLVKALRTPQVRGRWGEITLRRVAELAGMLNYCDFFEQETRQSEHGRLRPDMIVRLPNEKQIVVDSKSPLLAYLEALEAETDEERTYKLILHSKQIQAHMNKLSQKTYWEQFQPTPEFVVLFIPGENFFSSALQYNPGLIEEGVSKGVILATPTTLISLLKAVAFGWRQETMAKNAELISNLGKELYERISTMAEHLDRLGRNIEKCASSYNQVVGSFERRVLASARKFSELGIKKRDGAEILYLSPAEKKTRQISLPEPNDQESQQANDPK